MRSGVWEVETGVRRGSGPSPGVLERSSRYASLRASANYRVRKTLTGGVEYIFHLPSSRLLYGNIRNGLSPHENLVLAMGLALETRSIVAGHLKWHIGQQKLETNEHTGHYHQLWSADARREFQEKVARMPGVALHLHRRIRL